MKKPINYMSDLKTDGVTSGAPSMKECFEKHYPTKNAHNYLPLFDRHFTNIRHEKLKVLEIGVEAGTGVRLFADYFPNAEIYGFDIDPACKEHEDDRINIVIGDQNSAEDLNLLPDDIDIIIDDGLHTIKSQLFCFDYLFKNKMPDRGIYVVEDVIGAFPVFEFFNDLSMKLNYWPKGEGGGLWSSLNDFDSYLEKDGVSPEDQYWIKNVLGVSIYRHLVFVDKGKNPQDGQAHLRIEAPTDMVKMSQVRGEFLQNSDFKLNKN